MNKKTTALLVLVCFILSCFGFTVGASTYIPDKIDGPSALLKPIDGSVTKVKYVLLDDEGVMIDNHQIKWSASNGLIISEDGYVFLTKDTQDGNYIINAEVGGISAPAKTITIKSGAYLTDTYTSGTINMLNAGFKDDCNFEFDFSAGSASNSAAFFLKLLERDSNWHFPVYLRSHSTNYKLRFDNYSGTNGENKRDEYVTSYEYGTTQSIRIKFNYDDAKDYISSYSVYLNGTLLEIFDDCIVMGKGDLTYQGIRELTIRNTIAMKNIKLYSGEKINPNDTDYKYLGIKIDGADTLGTPRKNAPVTSQYSVKNAFGVSLDSEITWSLHPLDKGVTIDSNGLISVSNTASGEYNITALANGCEYSKTVTITPTEYTMKIIGQQEYIRDHTHMGYQSGTVGDGGGGSGFSSIIFSENYSVVDQFGEFVEVDWEFEGDHSNINITDLRNGIVRLDIGRDAEDGTYILKATAKPGECIANPVITKEITISTATYHISGPDSIAVPDSDHIFVKYELCSSIGNNIERLLNWSADGICILYDGNAIFSAQNEGEFEISVQYGSETYKKSLTVTSDGTTVGAPFDAEFYYNGTNLFYVNDGKNEKNLDATLVYNSFEYTLPDVEWNVVRVSDDFNGDTSSVKISGSKIIMDGYHTGKIYIQGKLKNTNLLTDVEEIILVDAFASLDNSTLTIVGSDGDKFIINHYKPADGNYIKSSLYSSSTPDISEVTVDSTGAVHTNIDLSASGIHKIIVKNQDNDVNEINVMINTDKIFEQPDVKLLLKDPDINEYFAKYFSNKINIIANCTDIYSKFDYEIQDKVILFTDGEFANYFGSVFLMDFLTGNDDNIHSLESELNLLNADTSWIDLLKSDLKRDSVSAEMLNRNSKIHSLTKSEYILSGIKSSSVTNTKEAKTYISLCNSNKYNSASEIQKNLIADAVSGKSYVNMQELLTAINGVNISLSTPGGGGSSSAGGGKTQTGSIGGYTPTVKPVPDPTVPDVLKKTYIDVPNEHWAYDYVTKLSDKGIINGKSENTFMPDANVTRAEFVKMLVEAFSVPKSLIQPFDDVNSSAWYSVYVASAYNIGLVIGDGKNFRPDESITRQDAAVMIYRFATYYGYKFDKKDNLFTDKSEISDYATESVNSLVSASIINGMPDGTFAPTTSTTRAQAAKLICSIIDKGGIR